MKSKKKLSLDELESKINKWQIIRKICLFILLVVIFFAVIDFHYQIDLAETEYDSSTVEIEKEPSIIFFYRSDCPDCHKIFKKVYWAELKGVPLQLVNLRNTSNRKYIKEYNLKTVPTFVLINKKGTEARRYSGTNFKKIDAFLSTTSEKR